MKKAKAICDPRIFVMSSLQLNLNHEYMIVDAYLHIKFHVLKNSLKIMLK